MQCPQAANSDNYAADVAHSLARLGRHGEQAHT